MVVSRWFRSKPLPYKVPFFKTILNKYIQRFTVNFFKVNLTDSLSVLYYLFLILYIIKINLVFFLFKNMTCVLVVNLVKGLNLIAS